VPTIPASAPAPLSLRDVLKISGFKRLWLAQVVSILGDFLAVFGVITLITFKWHGTPLQVTNVMIAFIIPMALVGPLAGVFVDRWNVKRTMIASDLIRAVLILGLVFVTRLEHIYVIFFAVATVSSFFAPSQSVTLRALVPMNGLMSANALMSQAFYTMRIIAPAMAGLLVYWLGYNSCFYLDTVSFVFFRRNAIDDCNHARGESEGERAAHRRLDYEGLHSGIAVHSHASGDFLCDDCHDDGDVRVELLQSADFGLRARPAPCRDQVAWADQCHDRCGSDCGNTDGECRR